MLKFYANLWGGGYAYERLGHISDGAVKRANTIFNAKYSVYICFNGFYGPHKYL